VLIHPGPSNRVMGQLARRRARPWLVAGTIAQLLASLLVGWVMIWVTFRFPVFNLSSIDSIATIDLAVASLIALAILMVGQAIVSYEIFTGKSLPRRGIYRYWRRAVILAAGYGALVGASQTLPAPPIYSLLISALLMTTFYALLVWRSFADREQFIQHLRPFTDSQRLYDHLLTRQSASNPLPEAGAPFFALCETILGCSAATLYPVGPLAPLVNTPLVYPQESVPSLKDVAKISNLFTSPQTLCVPLGTQSSEDLRWGVPLWGERGLIGLLLLGDKKDGGLYTQEEIEIARSTGERLIDAQASAAIARRLMALQRQRLTENQVLDRRARRVLHDEVLPRLHAVLLTLDNNTGMNDGPTEEVIHSLAQIHRQLADLLHDLPPVATRQVARHGLIGALRQAVEVEYLNAFEAVHWEIDPSVEQQVQELPPLANEVLYYAAREAIRNAARHGRSKDPTAPLQLTIGIHWQDGLCLCIEDDGCGLLYPDNLEKETGSDGSGQGLALHSTMMAVIGGSLSTESMPGQFTRVLLYLPQEA
jgi:signal transduction histidine kinase